MPQLDSNSNQAEAPHGKERACGIRLAEHEEGANFVNAGPLKTGYPTLEK